MAPIIRPRKFRHTWVLLGLLAWAKGAPLAAQAMASMPRISNVGVIPVTWQASENDLVVKHTFRKYIESEFPQVVRASHRFRLINDNLVKALWSSSGGRAELVQDYELHAFMHLVATIDGDAVRLQVRLLGPDMQIYLLEEEALGLAWINGATRPVISEKMSDLVFRLLNRLPIDVSVLAVQGRYVTLSGGRLQGLRLGDELDVIRPTITQVHPANGAWVGFNKNEMGKAMVVDLNDMTAIAKLTAQTYEDSVAVGDGVKIYNIPGRVRFARMKDEPRSPEHAQPSHLKLTTVSQKTEPQEPKRDMNERQTPAEIVADKPEVVERDAAPQSEPTGQPADQDYNRENRGELRNIVGEFMKAFRGVDLYTGINSWKVTGAASASSGMAPWLLNYFAGKLRTPFVDNIDIETGGAIHLGNTSGGSYTGFDLSAKGIYLIPAEGFVSYIRVGGLAEFESRNIRSESFGGGDYILLGGFAGAEGRVRYVDIPIEWIAELALVPIGVGQLGYDGGKKGLSGAFGYELELGVIKPSDAQIDWGGTITMSSLDLESGESFTRSNTKLLVHARYKF